MNIIRGNKLYKEMVKSSYQRLHWFMFPILIGCLLLSCEYEPHETVYYPVEVVDTPSYRLDIPFERDTMVVSAIPSFSVIIECPDYTILSAKFFFDNTEILTTWGGSEIVERFHLGSYYDVPGVYTFSLEFRLNTKSGSVADEYYFESFAFKESWVFVIE